MLFSCIFFMGFFVLSQCLLRACESSLCAFPLYTYINMCIETIVVKDKLSF